MENQWIEVSGMTGAHWAGKRRGIRTEEVPFEIRFDGTMADLEEKRGIISAWLGSGDGRPAPFFYEDRPDRVWLAVVDGETVGAKGGSHVEFTVTFLMPDPDAEGDEVTQNAETPSALFQRDSTRYKENFDVINAGTPEYREGQFGEAVFIEEGTENLLSSALEPEEEALNLDKGAIYTLHHHGGLVEVKHEQEEEIQAGTLENVIYRDGVLELAKHGKDVDQSYDLQNGNHNRTTYDTQGSPGIVLTKAHDEYTETIRDERAANWSGGANSGVSVTNQSITMANLPDWEYTDDMTNYLGTGWEPRLDAGNISQTAQTVRMTSYLDVATALVKETPGRSDIRTVEFLYWLIEPPGSRYNPNEDLRCQFIWTLNIRPTGDSNRYIGFYPIIFQERDSAGTFPGYAWVRLVIRQLPTGDDPSSGRMDIYINGVYSRTLNSTVSTLSPRFQFIMENNTTGRGMQGRIYLADFKYTTDVLHGQQSSYPFPLVGTRTTPIFDLSEMGVYVDSAISHDWVNHARLPSGAEVYNHVVKLEADVNKGGGWSGYQPIINGKIPQLQPGEALAGFSVRFRCRLQSYDYYRSPTLNNLHIRIDGRRQEWHTTGTWTATDLDLSDVGKASAATLKFTMMRPISTNIKAEISLINDGEEGPWLEVSSGAPIREIIGMDLSDTLLRVRFRLEGMGFNSPKLTGASLEMTSAYHTEGSWTSQVIDLSPIRQSNYAYIERVIVAPEGTRVIQEAKINGQWRRITNGFIEELENHNDLTGLNLQIRQRLFADEGGMDTPQLVGVRWVIDQNIDDFYEETSMARIQNPSIPLTPITDTVRLTPSAEVQAWQLEAKEYATSFHPNRRDGETLAIPHMAFHHPKGTFTFWAYENESDHRTRYLFDTDGALGERIRIYRPAGIPVHRFEVIGLEPVNVPQPARGFIYFGLRWDKRLLELFINGEKQAEIPFDNPFSGVEWVYLGSDRERRQQWNERFDEIHISNVARSDAFLANFQTPREIDDRTTYLARLDGSTNSESLLWVGGTAHTWPVLRAVFQEDVTDDYRVQHMESGRFIKVKGPFVVGDVLEIDMRISRVSINGVVRMNRLTRGSRMFQFCLGINTVETTPVFSAHLTARWKERFL